jgi:hypothetical protein
MEVNWCEVRITDAQGKTLYHHAFATDHRLDESNVHYRQSGTLSLED